jgi:hypothetical protein
VTIRFSIDRMEGDTKHVAVLLTDDGTQINFPRTLLPKGVKACDVLTLTIETSAQAKNPENVPLCVMSEWV